MDIMLYEVFEEEKKALLKYLPKSVNVKFSSLTIQEKQDKKPPASLISIRTQSKIPDGWFKSLKGILTRSQGYDHLQENCLKANRQIPCGYLVDYCSRAVAEHALMVTIALLRKLKKQLKQFGRFKRDGITGTQCLDKNILVVGVGCIGFQVCTLAQKLGMNVRGVDIDPKKRNIEYVTLEKGLLWADAIVCALPLTKATNRLLDYKKLKKVKKGCVLVNISRGEITPLEDLQRLLKGGTLGAIGMDVYAQEITIAQYLRGAKRPLPKNIQCLLDLQKRDNVIFTPHNAFNTGESTDRKAKQTIEALLYFLKHQTFPHTFTNF